jgi:hypothetical protein
MPDFSEDQVRFADEATKAAGAFARTLKRAESAYATVGAERNPGIDDREIIAIAVDLSASSDVLMDAIDAFNKASVDALDA